MNIAGAHMLGVVFNRIPRGRSQYYGGYQYYTKTGYYQSTRDGKSAPSLVAGQKPTDKQAKASPAPAAKRSNGRSEPVPEPLEKP
jgi:hypothetical protein